MQSETRSGIVQVGPDQCSSTWSQLGTIAGMLIGFRSHSGTTRKPTALQSGADTGTTRGG